MKFFECCHHCTKRFLGCHDVCPEYAGARAEFEAYKAFDKAHKASPPAKTDYLNKSVWYKNK